MKSSTTPFKYFLGFHFTLQYSIPPNTFFHPLLLFCFFPMASLHVSFLADLQRSILWAECGNSFEERGLKGNVAILLFLRVEAEASQADSIFSVGLQRMLQEVCKNIGATSSSATQWILHAMKAFCTLVSFVRLLSTATEGSDHLIT